jgi:glycosyltransferase involved in cell wall biosynthesis
MGQDDIYSILNKNKFFFYPKKIIFSLISYYWAISPKFSAEYINVYPKSKSKILELCQGVDIRRFFPIHEDEKRTYRRQFNLPENIKIILSVGYVEYRKGFHEIAEILSKLNYDYCYVVVGNNKPVKTFNAKRNADIYNCSNQIKSLLKDNVRMLGSINNIEKIMQLSDIFIINSEMEGIPNVLLEAMACGLVCFVNDLPGISNNIVYNWENGVIFLNEEQLLNNLKILINNSDLSLSIQKKASLFIKQKCDINQVAKKLIYCIDK